MIIHRHNIEAQVKALLGLNNILVKSVLLVNFELLLYKSLKNELEGK